MAIRTDFTAGEVLAAADLNDTFAAKLNLAGGKILQVVRATDATLRSTTSTSFVDVTGMAVTITPQKSTSAVILISTFIAEASTSNADGYIAFRITDSSNNAIQGAQSAAFGTFRHSYSATPAANANAMSIFGYATPATTSAVTYKLRFRSLNAATTNTMLNADQTGQIYAIEVSA